MPQDFGELMNCFNMVRQRNPRAQLAASIATPNGANTPSTANTRMPNQAETWFLSFALFVYDPTASIRNNFDRLSSQRKWGEKLRRKHWTNCQAASAALDHDDTDNDVHTQTPSQAGAWFQKFPPFVYNPTAGIRSNFERLAAQRKWAGKTVRKRWAECQAEEFDYAYGTDTTKLETWRSRDRGQDFLDVLVLECVGEECGPNRLHVLETSSLEQCLELFWCYGDAFVSEDQGGVSDSLLGLVGSGRH
ncbi:unnamed protein product [Alternaria alternata]